MPTFGKQDSTGSVGVMLSNTQEAAEVWQHHQRRERERMNTPEVPEPIADKSLETQVYIYNVSPWQYVQQLGSMGPKTIFALEEEKVLTDEMFVSKVTIIPGIPWEAYPQEGGSKINYHTPPKGQGSAEPGYNFALEVVGGGRMGQAVSDLRKCGVFISRQPEQVKPRKGVVEGEKGATKADWDAYNRWVADVRKAQESLRSYCAEGCMEANNEYRQGTFKNVIGNDGNNKLFQKARMIGKTVLDCPWLGDTGAAAKNKTCLACEKIIGFTAMKCGYCGTLQVTDAVFQAEIKRRQEMAL